MLLENKPVGLILYLVQQYGHVHHRFIDGIVGHFIFRLIYQTFIVHVFYQAGAIFSIQEIVLRHLLQPEIDGRITLEHTQAPSVIFHQVQIEIVHQFVIICIPPEELLYQ